MVGKHVGALKLKPMGMGRRHNRERLKQNNYSTISESAQLLPHGHSYVRESLLPHVLESILSSGKGAYVHIVC